MFAVNLGTLVSFVAGAFLSYRVVPCVMLVVPIIFILSFIVFPEKSIKCDNEGHDQNNYNDKNINATGNITFAELGMSTIILNVLVS